MRRRVLRAPPGTPHASTTQAAPCQSMPKSGPWRRSTDNIGDLFGRKRMFTLSVLMMSVPTLLMGLLPTYDTIGILAPVLLLLFRVLQGAAVGGEVPGAWVFVSEHVPSRHIGYACGTLTAGLTAGILLGSLVAAGINSRYSTAEVGAFAWRIPFLLGGVFGLFS
ncbi:MFS transporter, partial [Burkholderia cenocepacia]|nr:MFS transporter [Burkholderia cenocepacia]MDR5670901.1 MFS transporter [Burkholderia cenocepacia]